ncbi:MAG: glycosyltransferase family 2 protein [Ignavibacteriaceae bacterium]
MEEQNSGENQSGEGVQNHAQGKVGDGESAKRNFGKSSYYKRKKFYQKQREQGQTRRKSAFKKLSIVVPLFDEEESLIPLANEIKKSLKLINISYEVIFVDDGSSDNSLKIIKSIANQDKRFKYLSFQKNYGKSAALQVGFRAAEGDVIVTMDADLQDDPNEISNLLKKLDEGYDLVSGWKKKRYDPFIKKHTSKFFNFVTSLMSGIKIHDFNCGLKAYRKEVTESMKVYGELHRYLPVLADWNGFKVSEVVVQHHARRYGTTKFGLSRFFKGFIDLVTVIFSTRYIKRPMHFFGFFGAISFLVGLIVNGYLTYEWITGMPLSNRPMLFLGMLLIIVGVQFFSVGLLGEMIVHNFMNEKEYIIKDKSPV